VRIVLADPEGSTMRSYVRRAKLNQKSPAGKLEL
jgi:hypothetical protein